MTGPVVVSAPAARRAVTCLPPARSAARPAGPSSARCLQLWRRSGAKCGARRAPNSSPTRIRSASNPIRSESDPNPNGIRSESDPNPVYILSDSDPYSTHSRSVSDSGPARARSMGLARTRPALKCCTFHVRTHGRVALDSLALCTDLLTRRLTLVCLLTNFSTLV